MAEYLGDVATLIAAGGRDGFSAGGLINAPVKVMVDEIDAASQASGSTLRLFGDLPDGAVVLGVIVYCPAMANSQTLAIGDKSSATRYLGATSVNAAVILYGFSSPGYRVGTASGDDEIILTVGGNALASSGTIKAFCLYAKV